MDYNIFYSIELSGSASHIYFPDGWQGFVWWSVGIFGHYLLTDVFTADWRLTFHE